MITPELILASSSPYRKELLERLKIPFRCISPDVDEDQFQQRISDPLELAKVLATEKARVIGEQFPDAVVIGSDQLISFAGKILGKPYTEEKAIKQLQELSGKQHLLITACHVYAKSCSYLFVEPTELEMRNLSHEEIQAYVRQDQALNCAGSYKIESLGISLFSRIQTADFTAITGLPLIQLSETLRKMGYSIP
jgi:septum formation protein